MERIGIAGYFSVFQCDNPGRVFLREFRIVRHHDDQSVLRDLFQKIHDLDAGL